LSALAAETEALEITSQKLRDNLALNAEQLRHTALLLEAATDEAKSTGTADPLLNQRVELIEALLNHQQAVSESLTSRRSLIDEAVTSAQGQSKRYQDSIQLLESYVAESLRFNLDTLAQAYGWLRESGRSVMQSLGRAQGTWLEADLALQDPQKRA